VSGHASTAAFSGSSITQDANRIESRHRESALTTATVAATSSSDSGVSGWTTFDAVTAIARPYPCGNPGRDGRRSTGMPRLAAVLMAGTLGLGTLVLKTTDG
jgi:hypothetical protein